jgi:rhodanese-related sulfurtransferase
MRTRNMPAAALLAFILVLASCGGGGGDGSAAADDYRGALFVDVRTPEEFAAGHVEGALLIPVDELEARIGELDEYRDQRVVLYCRTGRRSGIALDILNRQGFTAAENAGAFTRLRDLGLPTRTGAAF